MSRLGAGVAVGIEALTVQRGGRPVLHDLTASIAAGRLTGLFGPSGSGKSTLIRAIAGVQAGVHGKLSVLGGEPGRTSARRELGYMTQAPSVYEDLSHQLVRNLSGGQRARVSLVGDPRLLLLDEPTVGLDPLLRRDLWRLFGELAAEGAALLVSSHVLDEARRCDEVILLRDGRILAQLSPRELAARTGTDDLDEAFIRLIDRP